MDTGLCSGAMRPDSVSPRQLHRQAGGRTDCINLQCEASSDSKFSFYKCREERNNSRIEFSQEAKTPCSLSHTSTKGDCNQGLVFNNEDDNSFPSWRNGLAAWIL